MIEALDERVLVGLAGLNEQQLPCPSTQSMKALAVSSGPLSKWIASGRPNISTNWFRTRTTREEGIEVPYAMRSGSRLPSSMTLSVRNGRPS